MRLNEIDDKDRSYAATAGINLNVDEDRSLRYLQEIDNLKNQL